LRERFTPHLSNSLFLIEGDCLKIDWAKEIFSKVNTKLKVISNTPYYATSPILFKLFEWREKITLMVLTMQLEVARRLVAKPCTKDYGILSVATQFVTRPKISFKISPGSFYPPPRVSSAVVKMCVREEPPFCLKDEAHFFSMVRTIFNKRRKMLNNTLKDLKDIDIDKIPVCLEKARILGKRRPETLSLEELHRLYNALY
jgi:16S rRNA (adenine1518-N6/adenine1519-N6)-dimethyltransferase